MPRPDISVPRPTSKPANGRINRINIQQLTILPVIAVLLGLIILSTSTTAAIISGLILAGLTALMLKNMKTLRKEARS